MSTTAPNQTKKKFTGFTSFFKTPVQPRNMTNKQKEPFTGFSDFYKKLKEREIFDDDEGSECDSVLLQQRRKLQQIEKEKLSEPSDKHFKPQSYYAWCKDKTDQAMERCVEENGDPIQNNDTEEKAAEHRMNINPLFLDIKRSSSRKYERERKVYDQNDHDNVSQISDVNPWFHNMLNKWRNESHEKSENQDFKHLSQIDESLGHIYRKLNAKQKIQLDHKTLRNVNTYPSYLQFQFLNTRMKNFLHKTERDRKKGTNFHAEFIETIENKPLDLDFHAVSTAEKRELIEYFNEVVKPIRPIDFKREDFKSWYVKMSSGYDQRYKGLPNMDILPQEDFNSWLFRNTEISNKKYNNEFSKTLYCRKQQYPEIFENPKIGDQEPLSDDGANESVSNLSSCKSRCLR